MNEAAESIGGFLGDGKRFVRVDQVAAFSTLEDETLVQLRGSSVWTTLTIPGDRFVDLLYSMYAEDDEVKSPPEESMSDSDDSHNAGAEAMQDNWGLCEETLEFYRQRTNDLSDELGGARKKIEGLKEEVGKRGRDRDWYNEQGIRLREKIQTLEKEAELLREKVKSDLSRDAFKQMEQMRNDQYERGDRLQKRVRVLEGDIESSRENGSLTQEYLRFARAEKDEMQRRLGVFSRKLENTRQNARAEREKFRSDMAELVKERDRIGRDCQDWLDLFNKEIRKNTAVLGLLHEFDQRTKKRIWPSNEDVRSMVEEIRRALR